MNARSLYTKISKTKIEKLKNDNFPYVFPFVKLNSKVGKEDDNILERNFISEIYSQNGSRIHIRQKPYTT